MKDKLILVPIADVTEPPANGSIEVLSDRWWSVKDGTHLLFYGNSPQCNGDERIIRALTRKLYGHMPGVEAQFVPRVYLRANHFMRNGEYDFRYVFPKSARPAGPSGREGSGGE